MKQKLGIDLCLGLAEDMLGLFHDKAEGDGTLKTQEENSFTIASHIKHHNLSCLDP